MSISAVQLASLICIDRKVCTCALQEAAEAAMYNLMDNTGLAAVHDRRETIFPKDMSLARRISDMNALKE